MKGDQPFARFTFAPTHASFHGFRALVLAVAIECVGLQGYRFAEGDLRGGIILSTVGVALSTLYAMTGMPVVLKLVEPPARRKPHHKP